MKNKFLLGMLGLVTVFALIFTGCDNTYAKEATTNAKTPTISVQPQLNSQYQLNGTIQPLTVTGAVSDNGTLEYKWYTKQSSAGGAADGTEATGTGATTASFTPDLSTASEVTAYYYVVVTNYYSKATGVKRASRTSRLVGITIYNPANAQPPLITEQSESGAFIADQPVTLSVTATVTRGTLSYQWYENTSESTTGGTEIPGGTGAEYVFIPTTAATYYYYVIVTNTDDAATGTKTTQTVSYPITVTVEGNTFYEITANAIVTVDTATKYQYVRGIGGMDSVEFRAGTGTPSPDMTNEDIEKIFDPEGVLGMNVLRIMMYDDIDGIMSGGTTQGFDTPLKGHADYPTGKNEDYFDHIKIVNKYGGYVIACPWTVPRVYKSDSISGTTGGELTGTTAGGYLSTQMYKRVVDEWFIPNLKRYETEGAPIFALSLGNENNLTSIGYEGMIISTANQAVFIRDYLGPAIETGGENGGPIKGYGGGKAHNKIWFGPGEGSGPGTENASVTISDTTAPRAAHTYIDFIGRHFYSEMLHKYTAALNLGKEVWQTEHALSTNRGNASNFYTAMSTWNWVWQHPNEIYCSLALNNESMYVMWYMKRFYGVIGDGTYGTTDGGITPLAYVLSHFSKFIADTDRVNVSVTGTTGAGTTITQNGNNSTVNPSNFTSGNAGTGGQNRPEPKILGFQSKDGNSIVVVMFTPTNYEGNGGVNMGNVQINLPAGFVAKSATAQRSRQDAMAVSERVAMNTERTIAMVNLPASNIVSIRFTK
jgi:O-glycosyl hydrolase